MPNDNLGTAHGSVRLDLDDRASGRLLTTLTKMSRQFDEMNKKLTRIDHNLNGTDKSFDKVVKSVDRGTKATKGFSTSIFNANKNITKFTRDMGELYNTINKITDVMERANRWYIPLNRTYRILDQMQRLRLDGMTNSFLRFGTAVQRVGILNNAFSRAWKQGFLGIDRSMRQMPAWVQNLNRLAIKIAQVGSAGLIISKLAKLNVFEKFLNTKAFEKIAGQSDRAALAIRRFVKDADYRLNYFSRAFNRGFAPVAGFAQNAKGFLAGAALIRSGIDGIVSKFAWLGRIPRPILMSLGVLISTVLPAALEVFGKALTGVSNLLVGLLNGVKQISGGLLVLPGLLSAVGIIASSLIPVFAGLKEQFKDVFSSDPKKALQAYAKLPSQLRPLADVIGSLIPKWKAFQNALQTQAFYNVEKQIQSLAANYMPLLEKGASKVIVAVRGIKDEFVDFLNKQQTMGNISTMYDMVAQALGNMRGAIQPALSGFIDIAVVGVGFLRDMTSLMPNLLQKFAQWASANRQNGNLLRWMQESREGIYDLIHGLVDLTKALWTVLTIFKTNTGGNFLEAFSDSMEKFNNAVNKSAGGGILRDIGNAVRGLGTDKLKVFMDVFKNADGFMQSSFIDMIKEIWPVIQTIAQGFASIFVPALKQAMWEIREFAKIIHELGLDSVIGTVLGLAAAFRILPTVLVPIYHGLKTVIGTFMLLRNAGKMTEYVNKAIDTMILGFDKFGGVGSKTSASIARVKGSLGSLVSGLAAMAGPLAAIAITFGVAWVAWDQRNKTIKDGMDQIATSANHVKEAGKEIRDAFIDDGGLAGRTVMDTVSQSLDTMFQDLDSAAQKAPGFLDNLGDLFSGGFGAFKYDDLFGGQDLGLLKQSDEFNEVQKSAADAQQAKENFAKAGVGPDELRTAVMGSADAYDTLRNRLMAAGDGFDQSIAQVDALRAQYQQAQADTEKLGTAGIQLSVGIEKIANAAGDTTSKLEGLKSVLQALGFLKTDSLQAAVEYADAIQKLSDNVSDAIASGGGMANAWDAVNGKFNENTQTGRNLIGVFSELSNTFLTSATSGGNLDQMMADLNAQLGGISEQTGISRENLRKFLTTYEGIVPEPIKILVQIEGKDQLTQAMGTILASLQAVASGGVAVPITFKDATPESQADLEKQIESNLGQDILDRSGTVLELKPNVKLEPDALQKVVNFLNQHGIDTTTKKADPNAVPSITPDIKPPPTSKVSAATGPVTEALAKLDVDAKTAADSIQGSADQFEDFLDMLNDKENVPQGLVDTLQQMRDQFENGGSQVKSLTNAIRDFSDATLDADSRAKNFIESLENVGKLPDDDSIAKYNEDVDAAIGYQASLVDMLDKTGTALVLQNGRIDQNSKNGRTLSQTMRQIIQDSAAIVAAGDATPEEAYANTSSVLRELMNQYKLSPQEQDKILSTYFPPDAFNKGLKDAMDQSDPRKTIEDIFANDPAKLNSVINLLDSNEDVLAKIVGPDGKLHIPSVFDPNAPSNPAAPVPVPPAAPALPLPPPQPLPRPSAPVNPANPTGPNSAGNFLNLITDEAKLQAALKAHPDIAATLQPYIDKAGEQGISFTEAFAKGIEEGNPAVIDAIRKLAGLAGDGLGSSPAKYGPLSGSGWTLNRGRTFTKAWAKGISSESGSVKGAVTGVAGEAATATGSYKPFDLGDYLKQLKDLSGFAQNFTEVITDIANLALGVAGIANTFSGGRLFPKKYIKDTSVDPRRGNDLPAFNPVGQPASNTRMSNGQPVKAPANAKGDEAAAAFISQAKARGWNQEQILAGLGIFNQETGYATNPRTNDIQNQNGTPGITGGFQQDMSYRKYGDPRDVNNAINGFLTEFEKRGQGLNDPNPWRHAVSDVQKPANAGQGGYNDATGDYLKNLQRQQALETYNRLAGGAPTAPVNNPIVPTTPTPTPAPVAPTEPFVAKPVVGKQLKDIGNGFYTSGNETFREVGGKYYNVSDLAVDAAGNPKLNKNGAPIANIQPTAPASTPTPTTPTTPVDPLAPIATTSPIGLTNPPAPTTPVDPLAPIATTSPIGLTNPPAPSTAPTTPTQQPINDLAAFDEALLSIVPSGGKYQDNTSGTYDLEKGLADCSSAVEDLVQRMDNQPTGGRTLNTHNATEWLAEKGFLPTDEVVAGAFNVAFNSSHMQATLPGGTNFNWGSDSAAALRGKTSQGAYDPSLTSRYYRPVGDNAIMPVAVTNPNFDAISDIPPGLEILGQRPGTEKEAQKYLQSIDSEIADLNMQPQSPVRDKKTEALGQKRTDVMDQFGLKEQPNAIDQASSVVSNISGIAGQMFQVLNSGIEAIGATKDITQTLIRYPSNTEDIFRMIDDFQKYIQFAADIAGATSSVLSAAGSMTGGMDFGGVAAAGQVAAMVQAALETWNAMIDLGQEAYRIIGTYVGDFLGFLVGGADSLRGQIRFLLDTQTNQLMTWAQDNPQDKTTHQYGANNNPRGQLMRDVYVFGGPGQDPRDNTRQMLLQVKMNQMMAPTGQ